MRWTLARPSARRRLCAKLRGLLATVAPYFLSEVIVPADSDTLCGVPYLERGRRSVLNRCRDDPIAETAGSE